MTLAATLRLLRLRLRLWWNAIKHSTWKRKVGYGAAGVAMLAFAAFLVVASWGILRFMQDPRLAEALGESELPVNLNELLGTLPVFFGAGAFLAGLFTSFGVLLQSLYLSGDMEFLLAAPLPPRAVFASKLIQAIFPSLGLLALFSGPALVGLGLSQGYHWLYYALLPLALGLPIVSGAGLSAVLVMAVVRIVSPRRAAELLGLLGGLVGVVCSQSGQLADRVDVAPDQVALLAGQFRSLASVWNPLSWPGRGLSALGQGSWAPAALFTALTLAISLVLLAVTLSSAERLYFTGWARVQTGSRARRRRNAGQSRGSTARRGGLRLGRLLPAPLKALVVKDFRLYRRDVRNLSQLVTPILLAVIWTFTLPGGEVGSGERARVIQGVSSLGIALFVGWMFAMRFAMGGLSIEGQRWWILKAAPLRRSHLLGAKFLVALIPSAGLSLAYLLALAALRGAEFQTLAYQALALLVVMSAECSLLLAFGIWTARFDWDNPRQINSGALGCLGTLSAGAFMAVAGGLFVAIPLLGSRLGLPQAAGLGLGFASGTAVCLLVGILPILLAQRRIPRLGEL